MSTVINVSSTLVINNRTIKNRIAKGALSEGMATTYSGYVTQALLRLYETWAKGGLGLCITGNVMIDREAKNEPAI